MNLNLNLRPLTRHQIQKMTPPSLSNQKRRHLDLLKWLTMVSKMILLSNCGVICLLEKLGILVPYPTLDLGCLDRGKRRVASVFDRAFHTDILKIINRPCETNIFFKILRTINCIILRFYAWKFGTKCTMIKFYLGSIFINTITPPNGWFRASLPKFRAICKPICPWGQRGS